MKSVTTIPTAQRPCWAAFVASLLVATNVLPTTFVWTAHGDETGGATKTQADAKQSADWQPGQVMDFRVINGQTQEPIPGVKLELQNAGKGINFQDVKVQTTDADGRSPIKLPDLPPNAVRVYPSKPGFVPLRVYWADQPSPVMPPSITIPMEPGEAFGGTIRNEAGDPIAGVTVTVHYWGPGSGKNPHIRANIDTKTTSDKEGRWQINVMPEKIVENELRIFLNHPDYISDHLKRGIIPLPVTVRPPLKSLYRRTAVMTMREGETIHGQVIDGDNRPIPNVSIYDGEYYWFKPGKPRAKTGEDGKFSIIGLQSGPMHLTVQAAGYAPELIDVAGAPLPLKIQLKPGQTVHGRVVDENGKPVKGVAVSVSRWRGKRSRLRLHTKSDAEGKFRLTDAPTDQVEYDFGKKGYMLVENYVMSPSSNEFLVTLKQPLRIAGSVVDAETGKPLKKFSFIQGIDYDDGRAPFWQSYMAKTIVNGRYETTITQEGFLYRFRVEAEGYMPAISKLFRPNNPDRGEITYDFKLHRADPLTGLVLGTGGEPLADADVYLAIESFVISDGKVAGGMQKCRHVKTDPAGHFKFPPEVEPFYLVVVHQQGIAKISEEDFKPSQPIVIEPWTAENQNQQIVRRPVAR